MNEIRWKLEENSTLLLKEQFDNLYPLIEEKMNGKSGLVLVSEYNYGLFACSTSGNFDLDLRIKFYNRYWLIIKCASLEKDEIRVYPD